MVGTRSGLKKRKKVTESQGNAKKQKTKKLKKKKEYFCDKCSKSFSKAFNLKQHKEVKHSGLAWVCPFCQKKQASKFSHKRHLQKCSDAAKNETHPDCNSFYLKSRVQYTAKSASNLIENLQRMTQVQDKVIANLKNRLLRSLKRNVTLKKILRTNHDDEDNELEYIQNLQTVEIDNVREGEEEKEEEVEEGDDSGAEDEEVEEEEGEDSGAEDEEEEEDSDGEDNSKVHLNILL